MKSFGIEKQILLVALIPIALMSLFLEGYIVYSRFNDLDMALQESSQLLVDQLASSSEYAVFSNNLELLQQDINAVLDQKEVSRVVILNASAKPIAGAARDKQGGIEALKAKFPYSQGKCLIPNDETCHELFPIFNPPPQVGDNANESQFEFHASEHADILIIQKPIKTTKVELGDIFNQGELPVSQTKQLGTVILEVSKSRLNKQKNEILMLSLMLTLIVVATSIFLAIWAARRISRPVLEMSDVLRNFGEGNLDRRVSEIQQVPELYALSLGFNHMAEKLQGNQEALENMVAARTSALAMSEIEYRTLVENTPDTIARYDRDCRRTFVNRAFSSLAEGGYSSLLGKRPTESPGGDGAAIYESNIKKVFATGKNVSFELKWPGRENTEICSYIRLTPERDLSGDIISVLGVGHDITELNETKSKLQREGAAKSRFLAAAGHDLRQPLSAANLFLDALKFTELSDRQNTIVDKLDQSMSNFKGMLEALLDISKLDSGVVKPELSIVHVIDIFDWIEKNFTTVVAQKQIRFLLHYPMDEPLAVRVDIGLLNSVLLNLITNACKYTSKGGILVAARCRGNQLLFQVWDTGIGIPEEHRKYIFDEFYQINNPQRDRAQGLGLGLYIAKRSLELLDVKIACHSKVGKGTVFEFPLTLANIAQEIVAKSDLNVSFNNAAKSAFVRGKTFVVIEDDLLIAEALSGALTAMGAKVNTFNSAVDAIAAIRSERIDYFIADYMLGGALNGIQCLNKIRQTLNTPIRAVIMSGDTSPAFVREVKHSDWTVVHKPADISQLINAFLELE